MGIAAIRALSIANRCSTAVLIGLIMSASVGCTDVDSSGRGEVYGTVTLDGQPVEKGTITFVPTRGNSGPTAGGAILDGKFHIKRSDGPPVGENLVQFVGARPSGKKSGGRFGGQQEDEWVDVFPAKYGDKSDIVKKIEPDANQVNFELTSN